MLHQTKLIKQDKTQTTTWRTAQRAAKLALLGLSAAVLVACGGGGGGGANPTPGTTPLGTVLSAEVQSGVVVPTQAAAQAANIKTSPDESGIILSNLTGDLANLQNGQVVHLPANDAQGIPLGFAGKVETQPDGTVKLLPAAMGDVFKTLSLDFDSVRDGGLIAGLVVPKNGAMQANIQAPSSMQTGLEYASCQLGLAAVVDIKCKNGEMEGTVTLQHPLLVNKKGSKEKAQANLYAQIDLRKMGVKVAVDFDEIKYASTGGFNILEAKVQGEWGVSMGIKLEDEAAKAEIPAWSELIRSDGANIWDENTKIKFSKYFELSGLNGDDKKGLIPLGGIYLTPANFSIGGKGFGGELTAGQLAKIKAAGVILWVYMDMSGNITLSGDLKFVEVTGGGFQRGFKIQRVDGVLKSTIFNTKTTPNVFAPRIKGKVESTQTIGLALAADVLVSGIRPATVKTTLLGFKTTTTVEGDGGYRWSPQPTGMNGTLCASGNNQIFTDFLFRAGINAKLDVGWINLEGKAEYAYAPDPYVWWEDGFGACVNNFALLLVHAQTLPDTYESGKSVLTLNFSEAYNNAALRAQVERWQVVETVAGVTSQFDADSSDAGVLQLSRGPGVYSYTVKALHKDINGTTGQPVVVAQSSPVVVNVSAMPSVAFSANIIQSNCKRLRVESSSVAGAGTSFTNYAWIVKPINANAITATGSSATIDLPVCGVVDVTLTVTDNLERQATVTRGVNTNEIAPSITDLTFTPATAITAARLTAVFSTDMQAIFATTGAYVPKVGKEGYWPDARTFVVEFSSVTSGGQITLVASGFKSVSGQPMAADRVYTFPAQPTQNLLLGAPVTDSCIGCTDSYNGALQNITDGNLETARNIARYSGTFHIFLDSPKTISLLKLLPSMNPNGLVNYEIQTSTDPRGAIGTWTSHGGVKSSQWANNTWLDFTLNTNTQNVRVIKVNVTSTPSWLAFFEIKGYAQ